MSQNKMLLEYYLNIIWREYWHWILFDIFFAIRVQCDFSFRVLKTRTKVWIRIRSLKTSTKLPRGRSCVFVPCQDQVRAAHPLRYWLPDFLKVPDSRDWASVSSAVPTVLAEIWGSMWKLFFPMAKPLT